MAVGVSDAHPQSNPIGKGNADIRALQRIRKMIVHALTVGVVLVAKRVVVETSAGAGQRYEAIGGAGISSVRAKAEFGDARASGAGPDLHNAGHAVGARQRARP